MLLLAIDTCAALGGVALGDFEADHSRVWSREMAGKTFSEGLLSSVVEVLVEAGVTLDQISAVVVVNGPGSFTGIRIGVSAAKGLAEGLAIPVIAISRLELLARKAAGASAAALLDAGRGEFYAGFYRVGVRDSEMLLTREAFPDALAERGLPVVVCEPLVFSALGEFDQKMVDAPTAVDALRLGAERFRTGSFDDISMLDANYLRRSETEMLARIAEHAALRAASKAASARPE